MMQKRRDQSGSSQQNAKKTENRKTNFSKGFKITLAALTSVKDNASLKDQFFPVKRLGGKDKSNSRINQIDIMSYFLTHVTLLRHFIILMTMISSSIFIPALFIADISMTKDQRNSGIHYCTNNDENNDNESGAPSITGDS